MSEKINTLSRELIEIMGEEIDLLTRFEELEEEIRHFIHASNWESLNESLSRISPISDAIDAVEERRHQVYLRLQKKVGEGPDTNFYQVVVHLEPELREECATLYRGLKFAVIKIQGITWSIDAHVRAVSETIGSVLDELFPHRKGKLYCNQGKARMGETGPMLVNQSL